ncbi:MAG: transglutaminase domain-containing protein [Gemmatales bacterium]
MSAIADRQIMSLYVTLLFSVACLGYAELGQQLPETPFFYTFMFLALGAAYRMEGKFTLSILVSNALAAVVLVAGVVWLFSQTKRNVFDVEMDYIRTLVSRTGPILCSLLLAKLFRPKTPSDQWLLQLLGLVQVILASVLAMGSRMDRDAPLFPVLMIAYLGSVAWSFRLLYLRHETENWSMITGNHAGNTIPWLSLKPVIWFALCFVITMIIFFSLPQGGLDANFLQGPEMSETGATSQIDLTAEGTILQSDEKVMRIWAKNRNGPVELPETMRLRGSVLSVYSERAGSWVPFPASNTLSESVPNNPGEIPNGFVRMEYDVDIAQVQDAKPRSKSSSDISIPIYIADPPYYTRNLSNYFSTPARGRIPTPVSVNPFEGQYWMNVSRKMQSVMITHDYPAKFNQAEWEQRLPNPPLDYFNYKTSLRKLPLRISSSGKIAKLSQELLEKNNLTANSSDREKAKTLEKYLSIVPFKYSLDRRREDTSIDPTEDFLFNVKEGHCERYASALVMMLRSMNIPSRIVVGYRGLEWNELGGFYLVRQFHAHAWVEALIGESRAQDGSLVLKWLTLDPTPANEVRSADSTFSSPLSFARFLWEFFILDFAGQAQRTKLMAQLQQSALGRLLLWWKSLTRWQAIAVGLGCLAFSIGFVWMLLKLRARWRRRKFGRNAATVMKVPFYQQLLSILSRKGWKPEASQTAAEFTSQLQEKLQPEIAHLPGQLVPPYYAVRFGQRTLDDQQLATVDSQLQTLRVALQRK